MKAVRPAESKKIILILSSKDKPRRAVPRIKILNPENKLWQDQTIPLGLLRRSLQQRKLPANASSVYRKNLPRFMLKSTRRARAKFRCRNPTPKLVPVQLQNFKKILRPTLNPPARKQRKEIYCSRAKQNARKEESVSTVIRILRRKILPSLRQTRLAFLCQGQ